MTRSEARAAGLLYYDEGRCPCPVNHQPTKRWVTTGKCFWCSRDYERDRRRADAATRTALTKEWRRLNPDKVKAVNARRDPEMMRLARLLWSRQNPEKAAASSIASRAKRAGAPGKFTKADLTEIIRLQGGKCAYCKKSVRHKRHIDHIMPIKLGGSNTRANIQLLCPDCNRHKAAAHPIDYARAIGLLL